MIRKNLEKAINIALKKLKLKTGPVTFEHPDNLEHGDYSTNIAMILAKENKINPRELAKKIMSKTVFDMIEKIEIAGPGFINFYLKPEFFTDSIAEILKNKDKFGRNKNLSGLKALVEYTDPNPFKEFHIGHLMSNAIGESISRLIEWSGAETKRACYEGDVGLHVAKTIWGLLTSPPDPISLIRRGGAEGGGEVAWDVRILGQAYARGAQAYEKDENAKKEIEAINKKIYNRSDEQINEIYDRGKTVSLEHFAEIYKKLGTEFNYYFFESKTGEFGKQLVSNYLERDIFEKSDGAVIFRAEKYDSTLHTRVFINKEDLPTYEAKELGLAQMKYDLYPYDLSIVITGNEVNDYFRVLLKALEQIFPDLAKKTKHLSHGMLRLPGGKMSSRTGAIITGESLLKDISEMVQKKVSESDKVKEQEPLLVSQIAVAAIKYSILKQSPGRDVIFDPEKSISFEGDSGPYLQYSYARAKSILQKAVAEKLASAEYGYFSAEKFLVLSPSRSQATTEASFSALEILERLLYRFPEVVERAAEEYAPNLILTYLTDLAHTFNTFYGNTKIVDSKDPTSPYKIALTEAFSIVLKNGLYLLGIQAPERM